MHDADLDQALVLQLELARLGEAVAADLPTARAAAQALLQRVIRRAQLFGGALTEERARWHALAELAVREFNARRPRSSERVWRGAVLLVLVGTSQPTPRQLRVYGLPPWKAEGKGYRTRSRRTILTRCLKDVSHEQATAAVRRVRAEIEPDLPGPGPRSMMTTPSAPAGRPTRGRSRCSSGTPA